MSAATKATPGSQTQNVKANGGLNQAPSRGAQGKSLAQGGGLSAAIAATPRVALQRRQLNAAFGHAIQRQGGPEEEELLQGKFATLQRQGPEEEELLQGRFATVQRQDPEEEELLQGKFDPVQRQAPEEEELLQGKFGNTQSKQEPPPQANNTGLPDNLKSGIENLSGMSMDDVKVHYNSLQPAQLNALAYAQGTDIHVGPGQEKHLPHEAWHVVQQAQGRVTPTVQMKGGVPVNDDNGLEQEADVMGARAKKDVEKSLSKRGEGDAASAGKTSGSNPLSLHGPAVQPKSFAAIQRTTVPSPNQNVGALGGTKGSPINVSLWDLVFSGDDNKYALHFQRNRVPENQRHVYEAQTRQDVFNFSLPKERKVITGAEWLAHNSCYLYVRNRGEATVEKAVEIWSFKTEFKEKRKKGLPLTYSEPTQPKRLVAKNKKIGTTSAKRFMKGIGNIANMNNIATVSQAVYDRIRGGKAHQLKYITSGVDIDHLLGGVITSASCTQLAQAFSLVVNAIASAAAIAERAQVVQHGGYLVTTVDHVPLGKSGVASNIVAHKTLGNKDVDASPLAGRAILFLGHSWVNVNGLVYDIALGIRAGNALPVDPNYANLKSSGDNLRSNNVEFRPDRGGDNKDFETVWCAHNLA